MRGADVAPAVLPAYASVNHDQAAFLRGIAGAAPAGTAVLDLLIAFDPRRRRMIAATASLTGAPRPASRRAR